VDQNIARWFRRPVHRGIGQPPTLCAIRTVPGLLPRRWTLNRFQALRREMRGGLQQAQCAIYRCGNAANQMGRRGVQAPPPNTPGQAQAMPDWACGRGFLGREGCSARSLPPRRVLSDLLRTEGTPLSCWIVFPLHAGVTGAICCKVATGSRRAGDVTGGF